MLHILNLESPRHDSSLDWDSTDSLFFAAQSKHCFSLQTSFLSILLPLAINGAYSSLESVASISCHVWLFTRSSMFFIAFTSNAGFCQCNTVFHSRHVPHCWYMVGGRYYNQKRVLYILWHSIQIKTCRSSICQCPQNLYHSVIR